MKKESKRKNPELGISFTLKQGDLEFGKAGPEFFAQKFACIGKQSHASEMSQY